MGSFTDAEVGLLVRGLAARAERYRDEISLPGSEEALGLPPGALGRGSQGVGTLRECLNEPGAALRWVLGTQALSRAGAEHYYRQMHEVFRSLDSEPGPVTGLLRRQDAADLIWCRFEYACEHASPSKKANPRMNQPVVEGLVALAEAHLDASLVQWVAECLAGPAGAQQCFLKLVAVRGLGTKIAAMILRETAWLYGLESRVPRPDLFLLQPIDIWLRRAAAVLWPDLESPEAPDFMVARRIAETCANLGVSGCELNQGAWYFGSHEVKRGDMREALSRLLAGAEGE